MKARNTITRIAIASSVTLSFCMSGGSSIAQLKPKLCQVRFNGTVTKVVNVDPRIQVAVGDPISGSLNYDPTIILGTVNPGPPGGPFNRYKLSSFAFTVGTLSGALSNSPDNGSVTPKLLSTDISSIGAFFIASDLIQLNGGNTFNASGQSFVIGNSSNGGIVGTLRVNQSNNCESYTSK